MKYNTQNVLNYDFTGAFVFGGTMSIYTGNIRVAMTMHQRLLHNVISSPMTFFESNPYGRIMNRFGKDVDTLDLVLVENFRGFIMVTLWVLATCFVVSYSTPIVMIVVAAASVLYFLVQVSLQNHVTQSPLSYILNTLSDSQCSEPISSLTLCV